MKTGYLLDGDAIQYMNINQNDHYVKDSVFIATKLFEKVVIEFSQTGIVTYSNKTLEDTFECSERGLQIAAERLEAIGLVYRVFKDENKRHRAGFSIDIDETIKILKKKPKDVYNLKRGDLVKHIVIQKTVMINPYIKELKKASAELKQQKAQKDKERYQQVINDLLALKLEYDEYIKSRQTKANKAINKASDKQYTKSERLAGLLALVKGQGFKPPQFA
ncbi:MAG: hypothetical protein WCR19_04575 [Acholeplasmataceae bacterium]